jgi:hypothetical protein
LQESQRAGGASARIGVLNARIIGNRLLKDSPAESPFGAGSVRQCWRDSIAMRWISRACISSLSRSASNDIAFPGSFTRQDEAVSAPSLIQGYRQIPLGFFIDRRSR